MRKFLPFFILVSLFAPFAPVSLSAQTSACDANTAGKSRSELQSDLDACNQEIAQWQATLDQTKQQSASYQRDVAALNAKINAAQANIKAKTVAIAGLAKDIAVKQSQINTLNSQIEKGHAAIAEILRKTNDLNSYSLAEAMLSGKDLSDFFVDVDTFASTEEALQNLFDDLRNTRSQAESAKADLAKQKDAQTAAQQQLEAAKKQVEVDQANKKTLLAQSQSAEKTYAQVLADRQAKAAQIRAALFPLAGVDSQIQFGTALQYATAAGAKTGVRPALILGILQQESNLGANVGSCVITDLSTGSTKSVTSGKIFTNGIHPTRDLPLLQTIVTGLGRDPLSTRVSCPIGTGYGGAMGPTQFIPSTWQLIAGKVQAALGKSLADPWNPQDAIYATAFMLAGDGAATQEYINERTAACRYYSGRNCYNSNGTAGAGLSYGNQVMAKATAIQANIDALQGL
jgi:membrane-bound lytic murein transglycosylase B